MQVHYHLATAAYVKLILHAHKYAFSPVVCGVLLGSASSDSDDANVYIQDAIPLFHSLPLAPLFEVAMIQVPPLIPLPLLRSSCSCPSAFALAAAPFLLLFPPSLNNKK